MKPYSYVRARDIDGAIATLAEAPDAAYLAGGTNLVDLMKLGVMQPEVLVDVRRLTSDRVEDLSDGGLRIGAAVPNSDLAADPKVRTRYPALAQALLAGASGQLRNLATTGGNLLQRTRCVYFYDTTTPCNKREPGSGCSALEGNNKNHAILGASGHCVATHPSDMAVAMAALDAFVNVQGPNGERRIPIEELHRLPGEEPRRDTTLEHGELITSVDLPPLEFLSNSKYRKARERASYAFALVSVAAALDVEDGIVRDSRISLGGVAHKPWRATKAEEALRDEPANEANFRAAADIELEGAEPLGDNAFKVPLARNIIARTLVELSEER